MNEQLSKENLVSKKILKFGEKEKSTKIFGRNFEMKKIPDLIFIIDTNIESLAVAEAKLNIPIIAVLGANSDRLE